MGGRGSVEWGQLSAGHRREPSLSCHRLVEKFSVHAQPQRARALEELTDWFLQSKLQLERSFPKVGNMAHLYRTLYPCVYSPSSPPLLLPPSLLPSSSLTPITAFFCYCSSSQTTRLPPSGATPTRTHPHLMVITCITIHCEVRLTSIPHDSDVHVC